jgi:hypothetical protein
VLTDWQGHRRWACCDIEGGLGEDFVDVPVGVVVGEDRVPLAGLSLRMGNRMGDACEVGCRGVSMVREYVGRQVFYLSIEDGWCLVRFTPRWGGGNLEN